MFTTAGTYDVRLIVTDDSAATDTFNVSVVVSPADSNQAPVATFTATPPTGTAPLSVFFDATGSSDPDGTIVSYAWDFGDGNIGTGDTTSYVFTTAGTYDVRLIVTDDSAATDTFNVSVVVSPADSNQAPIATFTADPLAGAPPLLVSFDATGSTDPDGTIVSYNWNFGDGNIGTGIAPTHTYQAEGDFVVQLIVTDDSAASDTFSVSIEVQNGNLTPIATFTATPPTGTAPLSVFFDATGSLDVDGTIVSYAWDFGDGNTSTGDTTSNVFTAEGTYNVRLIVTDDSAASDTFVVSVIVSPADSNQAPIATFTATPPTGTAPLSASSSMRLGQLIPMAQL